ncbi:MAG: NERD domain-containing protein [Demequinaceae bacterium]|nr:NERD domain-containing protein [Demequinaceae bacterium]
MADIKVNPETSDPPSLLLANSPEGEELGYLDLKTGTITIEAIEHATEVASALTRWYKGNRDAIEHVREASAREQARKDAEVVDLSGNRPGHDTHRRAESTWERIRKYEPRYARMPEILHLDKGKPWIKSSKGEEKIARALKKAEKRGQWKILHSVPLPGGGDVDHLLIGRDGVVVVNTRYYPKAWMTVTPYGIYVSGARTRTYEQVRRQADRVSEILTKAARVPTKAVPCVALVNGGLFRPEVRWAGSPKDVIVATNWNIRRALCQVDQGLTETQVKRLYEAARRATTWGK